MVHWFVALGTGLMGLAIGLVLGGWLMCTLAAVSARVEDAVSDIQI